MTTGQGSPKTWIVTIAAAAIVGGNFAILWHFEQRRHSFTPSGEPDWTVDANSFAPGRVLLSDLEDPPGVVRIGPSTDPARPDSDDPPSLVDDVQYFPFDPPASDVALLGGDTPAASQVPRPQTIPPPHDAAPIALDPTSSEQDVRDAIAEGLPQASDEEREIWFQQLKGLPPGAVLDLLRIRQHVEGSEGRAEPNDKSLGPAAPPPGSEHAAATPALYPLQVVRRVAENNLANAGTFGFKRMRVLLCDQAAAVPAAQGAIHSQAPAEGAPLGRGAGVASIQVDHSQGILRRTGRPLDVAVRGEGFLQVRDGDRTVYTRFGVLTLTGAGRLVLALDRRGLPLEPDVSIPADAIEIDITTAGAVFVIAAESPERRQVGRIRLARFVNPAALAAAGANLLQQTDASGAPFVGSPGEGGLGMLRQGFLEESNVDIDDELAELRRLQRIFEALRTVATLAVEAGESDGAAASSTAGGVSISRAPSEP